ncbi:hypothetical protein J6590_102552, partial [Homalodisca vitripennis]
MCGGEEGIINLEVRGVKRVFCLRKFSGNSERVLNKADDRDRVALRSLVAAGR